MFLASIPSPHSGTIDVGPFAIHLYGVTLLLAIAASVALTGYRWVKWGGDWDLVFRVAVWGVAFGIVGARLYHDITSWSEVKAIDAWWAPFAVWKGGLGVWGGILFGVLAGAWIVHRSGNSVRLFMDAVAPGLLLAQGIGRWGNWFNQELYGKPTSLPWGLQIDEAHRGAYIQYTTSTRPSCTSSSGTSSAWSSCCSVDRYFRSGGRACSPSTSPGTASAASSRSCCASIRRTSTSAAPERVRLDRRLRDLDGVLHLVAVHPQGERLDRPRAKKIIPEGPAMAVPKGRVRSGR
jgi:hypothetical protein